MGPWELGLTWESPLWPSLALWEPPLVQWFVLLQGVARHWHQTILWLVCSYGMSASVSLWDTTVTRLLRILGTGVGFDAVECRVVNMHVIRSCRVAVQKIPRIHSDTQLRLMPVPDY